MDRPAQEPPHPAGAADSPLSFPVEAPKLAGVEPGAGAPAGAPGEAAVPRQDDPLAFPAEAAAAPPRQGGDPLAFPAAAAPRPLFPADAPPADPLAFPSEAAATAPPRGDPLAFPPAAAPRTEPPLFPADAPVTPPADPLAFPSEAAAAPPREGDPLTFPTPGAPHTEPPLFPAETPPAEPLAFPAAATPHTEPPLFPPPTPPGQLPFPVAELPTAAAGPPSPAPAPAQAPAPEPPASRLPRHLPAALAALAALLAVGGCFLPLFRMLQELSFRQGFGDAQLTITETAWGNRIEVSGQEPTDRPGVPVGIPVIVAIVLLAAAAFAAFSRPGRGLTRWLLSAGAVFAAGVVTTVAMFRFELAAIAGEEVDLEVTTGPGMWLLALAAAAAAAAAVVAHLPLLGHLRDPAWADPAVAYADTPTPPSGVAITVLPPDEPDEPDEPPLR